MIKRLLLVLLYVTPAFAQDPGLFPDNSPILSKSIGFVEKLNRVAPFMSLKQGTIVSAQNMRRPAPGIMAGWGPRKGMVKNNTTAISEYLIDSLHQFINPTFGTRCFMAQTDNKVYLGSNDPPATGTSFGYSLATLTSTTTAGVMFSDSIGDDWVGAADWVQPVAWSGGTAYPDGFKTVIGGDTPSEITISNSDFETGSDPPTGWTNNNGSGQSVSTSPYHGTLCTLVTSTTASAATSGIYQDIAAAPGVEYTISYWAKRDSLVTASVTNADFETGGTPPTGWTNNNATSVSGTTSPHGGSKDAVVTPTVAASEDSGIYQDIAVNASTDYTITYWAYRDYGSYAFTNPGFESGTTGWTANNATLVSGTTNPHGGSKDIEVTNTTSDSSKAGAYQDITVEPNTEYTITFWAYAVSIGSGTGIYYPEERSDDGWWRETTSEDFSDTYLFFGDYANDSINSFIRFLDVDIDQGATISNAYVKVYSNSSFSNTTYTNIYFEDSDNAVAPTSNAEAMALTATSAYTAWDITDSWSINVGYNTSDIKTPLQEVIDRVGWSSGNAVMALIEDDNSATNDLRQAQACVSDPCTYEAELHVTYESANPALTVEAYTSSDSLISTPESNTYSPSVSTWTQYSETFTTPATTSYIRVYLSSDSSSIGVAEFDDVTITKTSGSYPTPQPSHVMKALDSGSSVISTLSTQANSPSDTTWTQYSTDVTTPASTAYIRLYLGSKATAGFLEAVEFDDIQLATTSGGPYPSHVMQFLDAGKSLLETAQTQNNEPTVATWTQYSAQGLSPATTAFIRLYLGCNSTPAGEEVYFDYLTSTVAVPPSGVAISDAYHEVRNTSTSSYASYPASIYDPVYVGFRRPVDGIKLYVGGTANTNTETMAVYYWVGSTSTWNPVGSLVDGTAIGGATLNQTGTLSWTANPSGETAKVLPGTSDDLYWYKLLPSGTLTAGVQIYKCTVTDDMEQIANLWSGYQVLASGCLVDEGNGLVDYTAEVTDGTDTNVMPLDSLANTSEVYFGFSERAQGINVYMVPAKSNTDATVITMKYWDGDSWEAIANVVDGTSDGADSLTQSGMIQWDGDTFREVKRILGGIKVPYYWYQASWSAALDAEVEVWEVSFAEKTEPINKYAGVVNYNNYSLWWPGTDGAGTVDYSQRNYPHILNGPYAGHTLPYFGGGEVNAIAMMGTSAIVSTKDPYNLYYVAGSDPADFSTVLVSDKVGAIAPKSLIAIDSGVMLFNSELRVKGAVFMAADGIYMTDGSTLSNISYPISDYFDTSSVPYIEPAYMDETYAYIDHNDKTLHFTVAMNVTGTTDTQTVANREIVYGYLTDEWYDVYKRDKASTCGLDVIGSSNEYLTYTGGFLGYVYRTNTGTADSGAKITHNFKTAPIMPLQGMVPDPLNYSSTLRRIKIKGKANTTSSAVAGVTVYPDGISTGVGAGDISIENSGYSLVAGAVNVSQTGDEFAFEFESDLLNAEMELYGMTLDYMPQRPE